MRAGDHNKTQRMFRARILAQGFTLVAMVAGSVYWKDDRAKRKEFEGLVDEKKAKEKQAAWIRELEARDEEDKQMKEVMKRRRERGGKGVVGELKDGETRSAVMKAVEATKATAEKAVGKEATAGQTSIPSVDDKQQSSSGVLSSVQNLIWGKK